ncbi:hypothetical protein [Lysinibacillus composti]|uniref:hypothetical protein n=1 Tax=Lysinibacillus composti TaxID=720633 RepID=UPI00195FF5C7|nr:hypothetical protein [Lysinibacillus composti]
MSLDQAAAKKLLESDIDNIKGLADISYISNVEYTKLLEEVKKQQTEFNLGQIQ